jgi:hypothetical protein
MAHDPLRTQASVDSRTAEEALSLAIRLQQQKGERVSIEELQRTAEEAGIDRVYLESALHQISQKAALEKESAHESSLRKRRFILIGISAVVAILVAVLLGDSPGTEKPPALLISLVMFAFVSRRIICRTGGWPLRRRF